MRSRGSQDTRRREAPIDGGARIRLLASIVLVGMGIIGWRMFQKSILEHPVYAAQAENQYEISKELPSKRGTIYAQDAELGRRMPVAATEERFDISVVPRNVKDKVAAARTLAEVFGLDETEVRASLETDKLYLPPLVRGTSKTKKEEIAERGFVGLLIEKRHQRVYPQGSLAAHLIGFVNREAKGNYGIEGRYDEELRGTAGSVIGQRDTLGRLISTVSKVTPKDGVDVELTIDHNVQFAAEKRLQRALEETGAPSGQVVIMDPRDGAILALAGNPGFSPVAYNEVPAEEQQRFQNPVTSTTYEPGSIMKPLVMAMAIDLGRVEPDTTETFGKSVTVQGFQIHTALEKAFGRQTMSQVLQNSDNVAMVWLAQKMTNEEMYERFVRFGLNEKTGIDLSGEANGWVPEAKRWQEINQATMSFGQGIAVSPIQMLRAWAALVNGGKLVTPHVVSRLVGDRGVVLESEYPVVEGVIRPETSAKLREMLESVVRDGPYGRTRVEGYRIGGKTGTAQIASPDGGYLDGVFTHSLMGFFPADDPQYLVLVKLDRPTSAKFAESTAGPVFHDLAQYLFNYYKIPPTAAE